MFFVEENISYELSRWYRAPELLVGDPAYGKEVTILMLMLISMLMILLREEVIMLMLMILLMEKG